MPITLIGESIFARCLSSLKSERVKASKVLKGPEVTAYDGYKKLALHFYTDKKGAPDAKVCLSILIST